MHVTVKKWLIEVVPCMLQGVIFGFNKLQHNNKKNHQVLFTPGPGLHYVWYIQWQRNHFAVFVHVHGLIFVVIYIPDHWDLLFCVFIELFNELCHTYLNIAVCWCVLLFVKFFRSVRNTSVNWCLLKIFLWGVSHETFEVVITFDFVVHWELLK